MSQLRNAKTTFTLTHFCLYLSGKDRVSPHSSLTKTAMEVATAPTKRRRKRRNPKETVEKQPMNMTMTKKTSSPLPPTTS